MTALGFSQNGDRGLLITLGDAVDLNLWRRVLRLKGRLAAYPGVAEAILGLASVLVVFSGPPISQKELAAFCAQVEAEPLPPFEPNRIFRVPVLYGGEEGPDLAAVAQRGGMTSEEAVALHAGQVYPVMVVGFAPGFPYLGGLDPRLHGPRLDSPRPKVPPGSVAVAGAQTGIYPLATPGGWQLIGRTPLRLFSPEQNPPVSWKPGDGIVFEPIEPGDYARLLGKSLADWLRL